MRMISVGTSKAIEVVTHLPTKHNKLRFVENLRKRWKKAMKRVTAAPVYIIGINVNMLILDST